MSDLTTTDVWILLGAAWSVVAGFAAHEQWRNWRERRRTARRIAAAEEAFWASLTAYVEKARHDIDADAVRRANLDARWAAMWKQVVENECRRLRADLDAWGQ